MDVFWYEREMTTSDQNINPGQNSATFVFLTRCSNPGES